jgi:uncharacterized protein (TIGR03067 family)
LEAAIATADSPPAKKILTHVLTVERGAFNRGQGKNFSPSTLYWLCLVLAVPTNPFGGPTMFSYRTIALALATTTMLVPGLLLVVAGEKTAPDELSKIGGSWRIVRAEMNGEPRQESFVISFRDGRFIRKGKTKTYTGSYRLDSSTSPRQISITKDESPSKKPLPGIYTIEGDTLTICFGSVQPKDFATKPGQNGMLLVLRHEADPAARGNDDK